MKRVLYLLTALVLGISTAAAQMPELKIDNVLTDGEHYAGKTVAVTGLCSHLCAHGGRKMFLRGAKGLLRIESSEKTGAFSTDAVNEPVRIVGKLCETRIDEAYLTNWEKNIAEGKNTGHDGCETDAAARGEQGNTDRQKIDNYRKRIEARNKAEGKPYLSVFYVVADSYDIL